MNFLKLLLPIFLSLNSCKAQENKKLDTFIITEFVKNNVTNINLIKEKKLYVLGYGYSFFVNDIEVTYLSLKKVKDKVQREGEFNMVSMEDIYIDVGLLKTSFKFLTAKKNGKTDFITQDKFNETYCVKYECEKKTYVIKKCR